jgi:D-alanyl-D-alanine carboxypeptidase (penicillin-binding protein 5/6)
MVLFDQNSDERRGMDGLTKLMTLLVAAEATERGEVGENQYITVSETAFADLNRKSETLKFAAGERMAFRDVLFCAFASGDDACNIIAESVSGDVEAFVARMNERALALGCKDTSFASAHGKLDAGTYTTARDMAKILTEGLNHPLFLSVISQYGYRPPDTNMTTERNASGTNHIISEKSRYYYSYATGGRVSSTYENGYGAAEVAVREGMTLVAVVLGAKAVIIADNSTQYQNLTSARALFEWGFRNYAWRTVVNDYEPVAKAAVVYGDGADFVNLRPKYEVTLLLHRLEPDDVAVREIVVYSARDDTPVTAPVAAGTPYGEMTVSVHGETLETVPLVAVTNVELRKLHYIGSRFAEAMWSTPAKLVYLGLFVLLVVYVIIVIRWNKNRAKKRKKR